MARTQGYKESGAKQAQIGSRGAFGHVIQPVGYERESHGYILVKIAPYPTVPMSKDNWKLKHVLVWEQAHSEELPKGWIVRFKDGNTCNFDPNNLCAMSRGESALINRTAARLGIKEMTADTFDVLRNYCKLTSKMAERERRKPRQCGVCGKWFVPDVRNTKYGEDTKNKATCRECLNQGRRAKKVNKND
jgi:hypothetical protein